MRGRERGNGRIEFITPSIISRGTTQTSINGTQDGGQGGPNPPSDLSAAKAGVEGRGSDFSALPVNNPTHQIPQETTQSLLRHVQWIRSIEGRPIRLHLFGGTPPGPGVRFSQLDLFAFRDLNIYRNLTQRDRGQENWNLVLSLQNIL